MTSTRVLLLGAGAALVGVLIWWTIGGGLERVTEAPPESPEAAVEMAMSPGVARIAATLFFTSTDGLALVPVLQEVVLVEGPVAQGRAILTAQLQNPPPPYGAVIPEGTELRAFFVTERGDAFVDLSFEPDARHMGGTSAELLAVYSIVHAVTENLPTIQRVQILIDGREADTWSGHVDLRRPLESDMSLVRGSSDAS